MREESLFGLDRGPRQILLEQGSKYGIYIKEVRRLPLLIPTRLLSEVLRERGLKGAR